MTWRYISEDVKLTSYTPSDWIVKQIRKKMLVQNITVRKTPLGINDPLEKERNFRKRKILAC